MKIAIYHPFYNFADNYSLTHVVKEQMLMITEAGHECHFITRKTFKARVPQGVKVHLVLEGKKKEILEATNDIIGEMDFVFTHDIVYLKDYKEFDAAIREQAKQYPQVRWLHWSHSAPNPDDKKIPMQNSTYIGLNAWDLERLAEQYQVPIGECRLVYNPVSPDQLLDSTGEWHPFTLDLVKRHRLLDVYPLLILPLDTGRFEAKGGFKVLKLVEKLRERKLDAKVIFINAAANDDKRRKMVEDLYKKYGDYAIFTSLENTKYEVYTPRRVIRELMQIGDVFPLLSMSEACSLTMLEAGICGMIIILNKDFPPFDEFGRIDLVFWMRVSSERAKTVYAGEGEDQYYANCAQNLQAFLEQHSAHRFKKRTLKRFNRWWIWQNQLEPILR